MGTSGARAGAGAPALEATRTQVLAFRAARHGLDREPLALRHAADAPALDLGVQDTGPDGAPWALAVRGAPPAEPDELVLAWTLRGAPHAYRRTDLAAVAVATAPWSEADAAKRVFDASKPLKAAGIPVLDALRTVATEARRIVRRPTVKGDLSGALTDVLDEAYLRWCNPCQATHTYEQTFRLAALQAGLELEPGTSPPVLRRIPGFDPPLYRHLADEANDRHDVVRAYLRLYGPATPNQVAAFLDAPLKEVKAHWPDDVVAVDVDGATPARGATFDLLAEDADVLAGTPARPAKRPAIRLVGPYDPYLQGRDRELLVPTEAGRKDLWRVLGRPGAVLADGDVVATWRPRTSGRSLTVQVEPWGELQASTAKAIGVEAERLAAHRGVALGGVEGL